MIHRPVAIGLTVCERVIVEEATHNVTLVNCFRRLFVRSFPSPPQRLAIYTILTDGHGTRQVRLHVVRLDTLEDVYMRDFQVTFSNPLQEVRLLFRQLELTFPEAGRYEFNLLVDGEPLTRRVIEIVLRE